VSQEFYEYNVLNWFERTRAQNYWNRSLTVSVLFDLIELSIKIINNGSEMMDTAVVFSECFGIDAFITAFYLNKFIFHSSPEGDNNIQIQADGLSLIKKVMPGSL
jgi:hypothetical protein